MSSKLPPNIERLRDELIKCFTDAAESEHETSDAIEFYQHIMTIAFNTGYTTSQASVKKLKEQRDYWHNIGSHFVREAGMSLKEMNAALDKLNETPEKSDE